MKKKIIPDNLRMALLQLKFTEKEIASYLFLLKNGQSSVQDISRATGINRVSIYAGLDELKNKSLAAESRRGKKKLYIAENPDNLEKLIMRQKEEVKTEERLLKNTILPILKVININQENKPQIKFFEGENGINKVFDDYILNSREAINCGSYETASKVISEKEELEYFQEVSEKKIFYRAILEDTPLNRKFAQAGKGIIHTKFLPEETKTSADIVVAGPVTALISYDRETATVIEDESIAQAIKMYLDFMWERL